MLLLSGGGRGPVPEAETMRRLALAGGVPPTALLIEPGSRDTLGNARETARLLRANGLRSVVLVSDHAHLRRAALLFRLAGVAVAGRSGVRSPSLLLEVGAALREMAVMPWSLARAILQRPGRRRGSVKTPSRLRSRFAAGRGQAMSAKTIMPRRGWPRRSAETIRARRPRR